MQLVDRRTISMARTILLATILFSLCSNASVLGQVTDESFDRRWIANAYHSAIASRMSIDAPADEVFWRTDGYAWFVALRVLPSDHTSPEFHLTLWRTYDHKIHARMTRPTTGTIYQQLQHLHVLKPAAALPELLPLLSVTTVDIADSVKLRHLAAALEAATLHAIPPDDLIMDPVTYQFTSASRSRTISVSTIASPGDHKDDANSIVKLSDQAKNFITK